MPVEIRELIIQAELKDKDKAANYKTSPPPLDNSPKGATGSDVLPLSSLKVLVREMVEEALRKKGYR